MIDKFSARLLLTLSSSLLGLTLIAMSYFTSVWQFYVAGSVIGITMAFLLYLSFPTLINRWFKKRVGFFIGVCSAASGIGGVIFNPLGGYLITIYGWQMTYAIFGIVILFMVSPLLGLLLRDYPKDKGLSAYGAREEQQYTASTNGVEYSQAIKMPLFYGLLVFAFLMISVSTLNLFIPNYITSLSYSLEQAAFVASAVMVGVTIGKVSLGMINDRSSVVGVLTTIIGGVVGLLLLIVGSVGFWSVIVGGFLFGWAYAGVTVQTPMLVRSVFGVKDYAKIYSNIAIALAAGGALMSGGWGLLADYFSFRVILSLGTLFLIVSGVIGLYSLRTSKK